MAVIIKKNGTSKPINWTTSQPAAPQPKGKTALPQCPKRQQAINELYEAMKGRKAKWAVYLSTKFEALGLVNNINPTDEYKGNSICLRRAAAINEARMYSKIKTVADILNKYGY